MGGLTGGGGGVRRRRVERERERLARYASRRVAQCAFTADPFVRLSVGRLFVVVTASREVRRERGSGKGGRTEGRKEEGRKEKRKSGDEGGERRRVESESE